MGGVALWPPGGREPTGGGRAEILAALANAAPRVVTAMEADRLKEKTPASIRSPACSTAGDWTWCSTGWTSVTVR